MKGIRIAIVLSLMVILAACSESKGEESKSTETSSPVQASEPAGTEATAPAETQSEEGAKPTITKDEYNKIKNGMSYKEVVDIVGGEVDKLAESGKEGDDLYGFSIMYEGEGEIGANANFIFIGDELQTKAQFGLE